MVSFGPGASEVMLATPWVRIRAAHAEGQRAQVQSIAALIPGLQPADADVPRVSRFLAGFARHPVAYLLPQQPPAQAGLWHEALARGDLERIGRSALAGASGSVLGPTPWCWDLTAALALSSLGGDRHDAATIGTVARRLRLRDESVDGALPSFDELDDTRFARRMALILRQSHYVTTRCRDALVPALDRDSPARAVIAELVRSERGHDRLLQASLGELGVVAPEHVAVLPATIALVDLLQLAARHHLVALGLLLEAFEGQPARRHPLAELLESRAATRAAARGVTLHHEINERGGHHAVGLAVLDTLPPISPPTAVTALRIAEVATHLRRTLVRALQDALDCLGGTSRPAPLGCKGSPRSSR
jgi:hypothetical protein